MPKRTPQRPRLYLDRLIQHSIRQIASQLQELVPGPVVVPKQRPMDVESARALNPTSSPDKRHPPAPRRPQGAGLDIPAPRIPRGSRRLGAIPPKMGLFGKNGFRWAAPFCLGRSSCPGPGAHSASVPGATRVTPSSQHSARSLAAGTAGDHPVGKALEAGTGLHGGHRWFDRHR